MLIEFQESRDLRNQLKDLVWIEEPEDQWTVQVWIIQDITEVILKLLCDMI